MKIHGLHGCTEEEGDPWSAARHRTDLQFAGFRHYHFCFVRVTGRMASIKRNSRLSQSETVSTFGTVGKPSCYPLKLGLGGRQLSGSNGIGESTCLMRAIA